MDDAPRARPRRRERDRTAEIVLAAAVESGGLAAFVLALELHSVEFDDGLFTTADACAKAASNLRLRDAMVASCGGVSPRKLGWILTNWVDRPLGFLSVRYVGDDPAGRLYRVESLVPHPHDVEVVEDVDEAMD